MKKKIIYLLTCLLLLTSASNVNAYDEGDRIGTDVKKTETMYEAWGINFYKHTASINGSTEFILCLQGGYAASHSKNLYVKMDLEAGNANERAYNAAMKAIFDKLNSEGKYVNLNVVSAQQAARVFNLMWYKSNLSPKINPGNGKICNGKLCGHFKVTAGFYNEYLDSSSLKSKMKEATNKTSLSKQSGIPNNAIDTATQNMANKTKEYFTAALNAAISSRKNGSGTAKATISTLKKSKTNIYTSTISFTNTGSKKMYLRLDCPECQAAGISINNINIYAKKSSSSSYRRIYLGGTGSGTNLKDILGNSKSLDIKIELPNTTSCDKLKVTLRLTGESQEYSVYVAGDKTAGPSGGYQEFIVYIPDSSGFKTIAKRTTTISPCKGCEDYYNACQQAGPGSSACNQYKQNYGKDYNQPCAECTTRVDNPVCAEGTQNFSIKEGVEGSNNSCGNDKNVKDCIIGQTDIANNPYHATTSGYPSADGNPYCKVYCTEDYDFTMPGAQITNSGRYLKGLETSIKGTKSCYTSRIDIEKFEEDLNKARIELIDAYNEWASWYQGLSEPTQDVPASCGWSYGSDSWPCGTKEKPRTCRCSCCRVSGSKDCTHKKREWTYSRYPGGSNESDIYRLSYSGTSSYGYCSSSCTCINGTNSEVVSKIESQVRSTASVLRAKIENYNKILKQYNSCSSDIYSQDSRLPRSTSSVWKMNYNFNPTIGFWYQDTYMKIAKETNLKLVSGSQYVTGRSTSLCSGDVDNGYNNCTTSWSQSTNTYDVQNLITCYATGNTFACGSVPTKVAKARYVKESMTAGATYRLPSQYYIVFPGGKTITDKNVEGSSLLEEKLPISLNVAAGTYTYTLTVQGLGEYYNSTSKTGRIWGDSDSVMYTALESDNACKADGALKSNQHDNGTNGEYVCAYKINCPNCPVTCVGDNCSTTVDCPGNNCHAYCDKCVFKLGKQNFTYRQISTDSINPNNRVLGANWNYKDNIDTKTEMKACVATNEILATGEKAYDTDSKDNDVKVMKVNLTQSMINSIKRYNKDKESEGGFGDNSLECYSYNDGSKTYNGVFCYSKFLDEYVKNYSNKFTFYKDRLSTKNARKGAKNQCTGNNCYWTTWNQALDSGLSVTTNNCRYTNGKFTGIVDGDSKDAIGPSYR